MTNLLKILERMEEGMTTAADAEVLRGLLTEEAAPTTDLSEILERVEEGMTTAVDAEVLRGLLEERYQGASKKT